MEPDRSIGRTIAAFVLFALGVLAWLALAITVGAQPVASVVAPAEPASDAEWDKIRSNDGSPI